MKKLFSVLLAVCLLAMTMAVFAVSSMAETEVVVWEGDINQEITTSNTLGIINVTALTQAIRDDLAQNGPISKYVLTSEDSRYVSGNSDYATWGFFQEDFGYVEAWSDRGSSLTEATWADKEQLSQLGQGTFLCLYSDDSDTAYVGHIKLVATHEPISTKEEPVSTGTTPLPEPTGDAVDIVNQGVQVWSGYFNKDFTTSRGFAPLDNNDLSAAIYNDILTNGVATSYAVVADMQYVSGESGYATFCLYQDDVPDYLEIWPDRFWPNETSFVWTNNSQFAKMNSNIQLAICTDTTGDVVHLNSLAIYATHSGTGSTGSTEDTRIPEPTGNAVDIVSQGVQVWSGVFNKDYTTSHCLAPLDNEELSAAIYNDILKNGVATAYAVVANMRYVSGESGYAAFCLYQDDVPDYLEIWPDKIWPNGTSFVWTNASQFAKMNSNIQLAICTDTTGDVIHLNSLAIYAVHEDEPTGTGVEPTVTEPTVTEPIVTEPIVTESNVTDADPTQTESSVAETGDNTTESSVTEPSQSEPSQSVEALLGDANGDTVVNMKDVLTLRKYLADLPTNIDTDAADVNGDGTVNTKDVLMLRKFLADLIDHLGA